MHIHHIHLLIHNARLLAGSVRFLGAMLLMLLFSLLDPGDAAPSSAMLESTESHRVTIGLFCDDSAGSVASLRGERGPAMGPGSRGGERSGSFTPAALPAGAHRSVFYRLRPGIVLIPRMNRTPKPKSVYRLSVRAPGGTNLL